MPGRLKDRLRTRSTSVSSAATFRSGAMDGSVCSVICPLFSSSLQNFFAVAFDHSCPGAVFARPLVGGEPAALVTGLRSDLPGQITAQVTSNVYDSPTGRFLLIPQGARLIGEYDSRVAFGQSRMLLVWTRLILPNGRSIVLERQPGADQAGYAGLEDGVNNHWGRLFIAAGLATVLNIGVELGADDDDDIARAIREGTQDTIGRAGDEIVRRQLSIPPTLTIRPGFPVRVMVTRDLILEPYRN